MYKETQPIKIEDILSPSLSNLVGILFFTSMIIQEQSGRDEILQNGGYDKAMLGIYNRHTLRVWG